MHESIRVSVVIAGALALVAALIGAPRRLPEGQGGQSGGPIVLRTAADVRAIAGNMAGQYVLNNDIDMLGVKMAPLGRNSATSRIPFSGVLDGRNFKIKNLYVTADSPYYGADAASDVGLFSALDGAVIRNLTLEGALIKGYNFAGTIAGSTTASQTTKRNQISNVSIKNSVVECHESCGGLTGVATNLELSNVFVQSQVKAKIVYPANWQSVGQYLGGVIGRLNGGTSFVTDTNFMGSVEGASNVGGLIGFADIGTGSLTIVRSDVSSAVLTVRGFCSGSSCRGTGPAGGLVGELDSASSVRDVIVQSSASGWLKSAASETGVDDAFLLGGLVGRLRGLNGISSAGPRIADSFSDMQIAVGKDRLAKSNPAGYPAAGGIVAEMESAQLLRTLSLSRIGATPGGTLNERWPYGGLIGAGAPDFTQSFFRSVDVPVTYPDFPIDSFVGLDDGLLANIGTYTSGSVVSRWNISNSESSSSTWYMGPQRPVLRRLLANPSTSLVEPVLVGTVSGRAFNSSLDAYLASPGYQLRLVDQAGLPLRGVPVTVDFSVAPEVTLAETQLDGTVTDCAARTLTKSTDSNGELSLYPIFGGGTDLAQIRVLSNGLLLANVQARSVDVDGDTLVSEADRNFISSEIAKRAAGQPFSSRADLNLDGIPSSLDLSLWMSEQTPGSFSACEP